MTNPIDNPKNLLVADEIIVKAAYVRCPHCDAEVGDWLGNPQGMVAQCDDCGEEFLVHPDADLEMDR